MKNIEKKKLLALILMLFPLISIIGVIIYLLAFVKNGSVLEFIVVLLTIPFGFIAGIFLWLNALGVIKL